MLDVRGPAERPPQFALPRWRACRWPRIRFGHQTRLVLRVLWLAVLVGLLVLHGEPEPRPHRSLTVIPPVPLAETPLHAP